MVFMPDGLLPSGFFYVLNLKYAIFDIFCNLRLYKVEKNTEIYKIFNNFRPKTAKYIIKYLVYSKIITIFAM